MSEPAVRVDASLIGNCPSGKTQYPSKAAARAALRRRLSERAHQLQRKSPLPRLMRAYRCKHVGCDSWHLTSAPLRERKAS